VNRRLVRDRLILHADSRGLSQHSAAGRFSRNAAFPGDALRRSRRQRASRKKSKCVSGARNLFTIFVRDAIRQALMGVRPIASFATATAAGASLPVGTGNGTLSGEITPAPVESGVPRAILPPMEEVGVGSGVGSDFVPGGDSISPARRCVRSNSGFHSLRELHLAQPSLRRNFRRTEIGLPILAAPNADAPASLPRPEQIADLKRLVK